MEMSGALRPPVNRLWNWIRLPAATDTLRTFNVIKVNAFKYEVSYGL